LPTSGLAAFPSGKVRVLAVGDSVAKGSQPSVGVNHPFTLELAKALPQKLGLAPGAAAADTDGILGCAGFFRVGCDPPNVNLVEATRALLARKRAEGWPGGKYDWAVLHGGINDFLSEGKTADEVAPRVEQVVSMLRDAGMKVVVIPPMPAPGYISADDAKEAQRARLPAMLAKAAQARNARSAASGGPAVVEAVLAGAVSPGGRLDFWNPSRRGEMEDGLHLKAPGYDLMGDLAAEAIADAELRGQADGRRRRR
jgi:lysophospholipase L1-like esterase